MRRGEGIMKFLMIKKSKAYFLNADNKEKEIDSIGKDDILFLLEQATNPDIDFEIDELDDNNVKNEARICTLKSYQYVEFYICGFRIFSNHF